MSRLRAEHLLPLACAGACAMLAASEFMDTFVLNGPGPAPQVVQTAVDQHHYALLVLAGFALVALAIAVIAGSKPAATAVAVCGAGALLIFLLIDLPDAGRVDTIANFTEAEAEPATGFWLQLAGALVLAICGGALATLRPDQLRAFARTVEGARPSARWRPSGAGADNPGEEGANPGEEQVEGESGEVEEGQGDERPREPSRSGDAAESAKRAH